MLNCAEWTQNTWAIQAHKKKNKKLERTNENNKNEQKNFPNNNP